MKDNAPRPSKLDNLGELTVILEKLEMSAFKDSGDFTVVQARAQILALIEEVIGPDVTELDHTIGSHSDDRGGDSDRPCHCERAEVTAVNKEKMKMRLRKDAL